MVLCLVILLQHIEMITIPTMMMDDHQLELLKQEQHEVEGLQLLRVIVQMIVEME